MSITDFHNIISGSKPVMVDFYADWCEPCKWLDPVLKEVETTAGDSASVYKIDIEKYPELKEEYNILSVPVLIIFKNGKILWRMNGFKFANELSAKLMEFI